MPRFGGDPTKRGWRQEPVHWIPNGGWGRPVGKVWNGSCDAPTLG